MKNELGMLKAIREDVNTGYGLHQLMAKEHINQNELESLCLKYPEFGNEMERRYGLKVAREVKAEKKQVVSELSPIKAKAKELKIKAWNLKSEETLAKEIEDLK